MVRRERHIVIRSDYTDAALIVAPELCASLPFEPAQYVLVDVSGPAETTLETALSDLLMKWLEADSNSDAVLSRSGQPDEKLWALHDLSGEAAQNIAPIAGYDVSLPLAQMEGWIVQVKAALVDRGNLNTHLWSYRGWPPGYCGGARSR